MISRRAEDFNKAFNRLPKRIQRKAREAYKLFKENPYNSRLHFKEILPKIYSVRVGWRYRAIGIREENVIIWVWIGSHANYEKLIAQMRG